MTLICLEQNCIYIYFLFLIYLLSFLPFFLSFYLSSSPSTSVYRYPLRQKQSSQCSTRAHSFSCMELACSSLVWFNMVSEETSPFLPAVSPFHHLHESKVPWALACLPAVSQGHDYWTWSSSGTDELQRHGERVEDGVGKAWALETGWDSRKLEENSLDYSPRAV